MASALFLPAGKNVLREKSTWSIPSCYRYVFESLAFCLVFGLPWKKIWARGSHVSGAGVPH
jgi:hypothetical protein